MVAIAVHNYPVMALINTNKHLQHKEDPLLYVRGFLFRLHHQCFMNKSQNILDHYLDLIHPSSLIFLPLSPSRTHTHTLTQ